MERTLSDEIERKISDLKRVKDELESVEEPTLSTRLAIKSTEQLARLMVEDLETVKELEAIYRKEQEDGED